MPEVRMHAVGENAGRVETYASSVQADGKDAMEQRKKERKKQTSIRSSFDDVVQFATVNSRGPWWRKPCSTLVNEASVNLEISASLAAQGSRRRLRSKISLGDAICDWLRYSLVHQFSASGLCS
jgi:hypothetical protein